MTKHETLEYEKLKEKKNLTDNELKKLDYLDRKFKLEYFKEELKNEQLKKNPDKKYIEELKQNIEAYENSKNVETNLFLLQHGKSIIFFGLLALMFLKGKK